MSSIAIITDTDASIPLPMARKFGIVQVPILVQFGEDSFRAVDETDDAAVFARINREGKLPTTSAPSPGQFAEAFKAAFESGAEAVLCFTVSGEVSATFASAHQAAGMFPEKMIRVMDTQSLTMGQGMMVLAAAEAVSRGASLEDATRIAEDLRERTHLFAALATLKYLAMSGRVGHLAAGIANLMDVKPILTIRNGKLDLLERVRTQGKAWDRVVALSLEAAAGRPIERMSIIHVCASKEAKLFEARLRAALDCPNEILFAELTPGLSVHSGAGLVGVVLVTAK